LGAEKQYHQQGTSKSLIYDNISNIIILGREELGGQNHLKLKDNK
jgi:hypothetical protein